MATQPISSLTAPADMPARGTDAQAVPRRGAALTDEQTDLAVADLQDTSNLAEYPQIDRRYADPPLDSQRFTMFSFIPSQGATPDSDGVFGMMKPRGAFETERECDERTEFLIRNVDSYHKIFLAKVGRPCPITTSSAFSANQKEVDVSRKTAAIMSKDILAQKKEEQNEINDMKTREQNLLDESKANQDGVEEDPLDVYIRLRVRNAQLIWTYLETKKKMDEMQANILKARGEIEEANTEHPENLTQYMERYMAARRKSGLPETDDSFMQFMNEDLVPELGF